MKKILEVLQYGDHEFRFNTDLDPQKHPQEIADLPAYLAFAMATKLWGGNEIAVIAAVRSLAMADLAVSVNRKEMIRQLDRCSEDIARIFRQTKEDFEKSGGKVKVFGPGVPPPKRGN